MTKLKTVLRSSLFTLAAAGVGLSAQTDKAHAYDMDCKVILCIAGGFPASCSDAYAYMIKRITRFPSPLPPFGFCAMSDGSEYKAHDVNYSFVHQGPESFECPEGKKLNYRREESDSGNISEYGFCYSHSTWERDGWGSDSNYRLIFHNRSPAKRINFKLNIVIEPGTNYEYRSPLFHINYHTGYVSQRPL